MINVIDLVKSQAGKMLVNEASKFLGESSTKTQTAVDAALPSILTGLLGNATSGSGGASMIFDMIKSQGLDGSMLSNLSGMFSGGQNTVNMLDQGNGLLSSLMGDKVGGVVDLIADFAGIKNTSAGSLLRMAAPLVMSVIGKQVASKGMNASGLMDMLKGQSGFIKAALPAGFSGLTDMLGVDLDKVGATLKTADPVNPTPAAPGGGNKTWLWMGIILAALAAFMAYRSCNTAAPMDALKDATDKVTETAANAGNAVTNAASDALDATTAAARQALDGISFAAGSVGDQFYQYMKSGEIETGKTFRFENLTFNTGSAEITESSLEEIQNLAKILEAYPGLKVQIQGHTDNTGDAAANKVLSQNRAEAVRTELVEMGIADTRLVAMGYGDTMPKMDNSTDEGRQANRRTEVMILSK